MKKRLLALFLAAMLVLSFGTAAMAEGGGEPVEPVETESVDPPRNAGGPGEPGIYGDAGTHGERGTPGERWAYGERGAHGECWAYGERGAHGGPGAHGGRGR